MATSTGERCAARVVVKNRLAEAIGTVALTDRPLSVRVAG